MFFFFRFKVVINCNHVIRTSTNDVNKVLLPLREELEEIEKPTNSDTDTDDNEEKYQTDENDNNEDEDSNRNMSSYFFMLRQMATPLGALLRVQTKQDVATTNKKEDDDNWDLPENECERRLSKRKSQQSSGDGASSVQFQNNIFYDVVGGVNKKGRIFGLDSEAGKYKPSSSRLFDGISNYEYEKMRNLVSNLSQENKTLKEQLQSHLELIRASQEES
ncbi:hypothetical protein Fmac_001974 [Flemingia macrophylla]|uniref:Uncharacterized protein n=1 Tax=Flemingia macrophylla TaxID=520843 RepID=A0ABD1NIM2_9FABA